MGIATMPQYLLICYLVLAALTVAPSGFALPAELANRLDFQGETYGIRRGDRLFNEARLTQGCTGKKLGLYVPYNAVKFFWSGFGVASSDRAAEEIAQHMAQQEGKTGVTLEMLLKLEQNAHIKPCVWTVPVEPACRQFWQDLSCEYATATKGEVRVILGPKLNPESAWLTIEKGQLEHRRSNGQDLWGFKHYELQTVYCKEMAAHQTQYPEVKNQICGKPS